MYSFIKYRKSIYRFIQFILKNKSKFNTHQTITHTYIGSLSRNYKIIENYMKHNL